MAVRVHQRIGGVDYLVAFPAGVRALAPAAIQTAFACCRQPEAGDGICVELTVGEMPDLSAWRVLVSAGPAWSIRRYDGQRSLCLGAPSATQVARLVACWPEETNFATVHCGPEALTLRPEGLEMSNSAAYPVDQVLLIYHLAQRGGVLVHAAGLVTEGRALLFPGVSGAGKSTLARQFLACGSSGLLSDDRVLVRAVDGNFRAFGTPWPGEAEVALNASAPLAAILFPARGAETCVRELSAQAALDRLLPATSILWHERELLFSQLTTCEELLRHVPAFELSWSPGAAVVDDLQEFVRKL